MCFAFQLTENDNKFELELFFNDKRPDWSNAIPDQDTPSYAPSQRIPGIDSYIKYSFNGFSYMQNWVANTILKRKTGKDDASIVAMTIPQESKISEFDLYAVLIAEVLPLFLLAIFVFPLFRTVYRVVSEKETKVRESMRMMGMKDISYWMSWITYYTIINLILSLLVFAMLYLSDSISYTSPLILFLITFLYGQSIFGLIVIGQAMFDKAIYASLVMSSLYLGSSVIAELVDVPNFST